MWEIDRAHLKEWMLGRLFVAILFDLPAFIGMARGLGVPMRLSTKKEGTRALQKMGGRVVPSWKGRILLFNQGGEELVLGGGMVARFVCDLVSPEHFLRITVAR